MGVWGLVRDGMIEVHDEVLGRDNVQHAGWSGRLNSKHVSLERD